MNSSQYREAAECIAKDRINFSQRTLLEVRVKIGGKQTGKMLGLNDAVLSRGEISRLVRLRTRVNGESLTEFNADGLIVATATGSTAYSLSAGGPILDPESGVLVITPICPHVLTNRSIIVAETSMIEIEVSEPDYPVFLTVDGHDPERMDFGSVVTIRKAKKTLPLAAMPDVSFFSVVRQKLKWSGSSIGGDHAGAFMKWERIVGAYDAMVVLGCIQCFSFSAFSFSALLFTLVLHAFCRVI